MSQEIMLLQSVADLGLTLSNVMSAASVSRSSYKKKLVVLQEDIHLIKHLCRAAGIKALVEDILAQMETAARALDQERYPKTMVPIALQLLELQFQLLKRNLESYMTH